MAWQDFNNVADISAPSFPVPQPKPKKGGRGGTLTSLISEGGAIGGGALGASIGTGILPGIGTLLGGALGAGVGAFTGRVAENKVRDDRLGFGDAAKEGALSAVLGGGPLRLGKAAITAGKAAKGGSTLAEALKQGGEAGVNMNLRKSLGDKLTQTSNDLAIKEFRLTPTQLSNFKSKFGEDPSAVIKRYKLSGKDSDAIKQTAIEPLQAEFDTIASKIPAIPTSTIQAAFKAKYGKLVNSAVQDNKAVGLQLKKQADEIVKKYGDTIDGSEVAALRREFDSLVSYADKTANPARYNVNKRAADSLRSALQDTADKVGLKSTGGKSFKEVGQELSKLRQLTDNISRQENLGRGNLPLTIPGLLGAGAGATAGPAGALLGGLATVVTNSPAGRKAIASGAEKAGTRLSGGGGLTNPYSSTQLASRILPAAGLGAALSAGNQDLRSNNMATTDTMTSASATPIAVNMPQLSQNTPDMSSPNPLAPENLQNSIQQILANSGDIEQADKFVALAERLQKLQGAGQPKPLTASQATRAAAANNALQDIPMIAQAIESGKLGGAKALPGSNTQIGRRLLGTEDLDAALFNIADNILRARSGAAAPEAEVKRFVNTFLPAATDSREAKLEKLARTIRELQGYVNPATASGDTLEDVLMTMQGGTRGL